MGLFSFRRLRAQQAAAEAAAIAEPKQDTPESASFDAPPKRSRRPKMSEVSTASLAEN